MVYKWKTGYFKTDPKVAGEEFERLASENRLTAEDLVEESRPEDAPLHGEFEWDDNKAAELYRQQQAKVIICNLVLVNDESPEQESTRAYVMVEQATHQYEPITAVIRNEDKLQALYQQAKRELESFRNKYKMIKVFEQLFRDIDNLPEVPNG